MNTATKICAALAIAISTGASAFSMKEMMADPSLKPMPTTPARKPGYSQSVEEFKANMEAENAKVEAENARAQADGPGKAKGETPVGQERNDASSPGTPGSSYTGSKASSHSTSTGGPVHVKGYHRKDGTYVRPHTRKR